MTSMRKICVVTGSRAEYGLLYWVLREIKTAKDLELQLVVTGMHLSPEFGLTYHQIEKDGFSITRKVEMLLSSDTAAGVAKSTGLGMIGFGDTFEILKPDIVLMLGDRFELLAAASAALFAALPIAHIHGGEVTTGAFDEAIRHSITKMSHLHFTATQRYLQRIIQMGEDSTKVFNVGAPGLDNIRRLRLMDQSAVECAIGIEVGVRSLLVTWHPVTLEQGENEKNFSLLLKVLSKLDQVHLIFTKANADAEGRMINRMIDDFVAEHADTAVAHKSLGQLLYLSTIKYMNGVVGNSSSGIIEAPSLGVGTINIGDRQTGRERAVSVIDCAPDEVSISRAFETLFSDEFQRHLPSVDNPYDNGHDVAGTIIEILRAISLKGIVKKSFFDLEFPASGPEVI